MAGNSAYASLPTWLHVLPKVVTGKKQEDTMTKGFGSSVPSLMTLHYILAQETTYFMAALIV